MGFEDVKRRLGIAVMDRIINGRERMTCRQLLQETIPDYIKEHLLTLAQRRLIQEKPITWNPTANFDINDQEVRICFDRLMAALARSIQLPRKELEHCLRAAVDLRFDVLLQPYTALENFLFASSQPPDKKQLLHKFELAGSDMPFVARLKEKVTVADQNNFSRLFFALAAREIVQLSYFSKDKTALMKEFELFTHLFKMECGLRPPGVDTAMVEQFLHNRGLDSFLPLVTKKSQQGKVKWCKEDFQDLFDFHSSSAGSGPVSIRKLTSGDSLLPRIIFQEEEAGPVFHAQRDHQPPGPYPSIQTLMDPKDYKVLVQKVFKSDEREFLSFIEKVDQMDKWREAKQLIDGELSKRRLDPYCKEAVKLGDIVFAKYFHNDK